MWEVLIWFVICHIRLILTSARLSELDINRIAADKFSCLLFSTLLSIRHCYAFHFRKGGRYFENPVTLFHYIDSRATCVICMIVGPFFTRLPFRKVKLALCITKYHAMKTYGGVGV